MEFHEKAIYLYMIGLLQLASKRVLSGSDCPKSTATGASPQTPLGKLTALPKPLAALSGPTSKAGRGRRGKERGKGGKGEGRVGKGGKERRW